MINFFKKNKNKIKKSGFSFRVNPHKHWKFLLKMFCFSSILLIVFGLFIFYRINSEQIKEIEKVEPTRKNIIKEKLLEEMVSLFEEKRMKTENIKNSLFEFKDPSI
jgi:hypothetical protein